MSETVEAPVETFYKPNLYQRLLLAYKRRQQRNANLSVDRSLQIARKMMERESYAFMISHGVDGYCSSRLVQPVVDVENWRIWIGTRRDLRKVQEVRQNPNVTMAYYSHKQQANLLLYGKAYIEESVELRERLWKPEWIMFFENGPAADECVLIGVEPERMEIMNFGRNLVPPQPYGLKPVTLERSGGIWAHAQH